MLLHYVLALLFVTAISADKYKPRDFFNITTCYCHKPLRAADEEGNSTQFVSGRYLGIVYYNAKLASTYAFNVTERVEGPRLLYDLVQGNHQPFQRRVCERFEGRHTLCFEKWNYLGGKMSFDDHDRGLDYKDYPNIRPFIIDLTSDCENRCTDELRLKNATVDNGSLLSYQVKAIDP